MLANLSNNTINKVNKNESGQDRFNSSNIVFIDPRVDNFNSLLSGLKANVEAVILDSTKDGIEQITDFLKGRTGAVDSVQILSHGSAGNLQLGSTQLNSETLGKYQQSLQEWFSPLLNKTPDLLLYGCDVASGEVGKSFMQKFSQLTGADVAASVDLTGNAAKGGNWILEKATGAIEAGQAFTRKVRNAYQDILATTFTVTNTNDSGPNSLRDAITQANSTAGADIINFNIGLGGPQTIRIGSTTGLPLPYINDTVTINGESQPGFSNTNTPIIVLDGTAVGGAAANLDGLRFVRAGATGTQRVFPVYGGSITSGDSSNSVVQGLVISNFSGSGIKLGHSDIYTTAFFNPSNITIQRNYIGTDITGTVAKPTSTWGDPQNTHALHVYGSTNNQLLNNLVSGNFTSTVVLRGTTGNTVNGNKVGTDVSGRVALGNQRWGLYIISGTNTITNNLVAANGLMDDGSGLPGVDVRVAGPVTGNTVGTDITGTYSLNNRSGFTFSGPTPSDVNNNIIQGGATASIVPFNTIRTFPSFVTPTLTAGSPFLSAISQNNTNNNGTLVKDIVGSSIGNYAPIPTPGIAITATDNTNGTWQYSTDNGFSWANVNLNFPTTVAGGYNVWVNSGYPAPNNPAVAPNVIGALLLSADDKNRMRFIPNAGYTGTTNSITYRGWNQRFGGNGEMINISGFMRTVGSMQVITNNMSSGSNTARIQVLPTNVSPTLNPSNVIPTVAFISAVNSTAGVVVSSILATSVTDPDAGAQKGIAITDLDSTNGTWQYSINGQHWIPIASATDTASVLLDSTSKLRFVPNIGYTGAPSPVTIRAWDQTNGTNGSQLDTTTNGGSSSISGLFAVLGNTAPVLDSSLVPVNTTQVSANSGILIADLAATAITDVDVAALEGIAITDAPNTDGTWQYSTNGGTAWIPFGAVSPTNALLLDINNRVRFLSSSSITVAPTLSFRAWDQTGGTPGILANVTVNGGSTSFSTQLATTTFIVSPESVVPSSTTNLSPELLSLLRNPPAPETPSAIVIGTAPTPEQPSGNTAGGNTDCLCEQVIAQQQPNLVSDTIWGTNEADLLVTTSTANTVYGYQGNDTIVGIAGNENLFGGAGNDEIRGARGRDFIRGGGGDDVLYGGRGQDVVKGGRNKDLIFGGRGADMLAGGKGSDVIYGGRGNDFISGGKGKDRLFGGLGDDSLCGCAGDDFLRGGRGNDTLSGEKGNDILVGGLGDDTLTGGAGSDRFRLVANHGINTITDFEAGVDFLELARGLQISDLQIVQGTGATVIGLQPGSLFASDRPLAVLLGVNAASLTPNSFLTV